MPRRKRSDPKTMMRAGELRKASTPAERKLWSPLRNNQVGNTFRRQHALGNYVSDFCSPKARLIIELDGGQHREQEEYDEERSRYLESIGYRVIRFWNTDVIKDMDGVILAILQVIEDESESG